MRRGGREENQPQVINSCCILWPARTCIKYNHVFISTGFLTWELFCSSLKEMFFLSTLIYQIDKVNDDGFTDFVWRHFTFLNIPILYLILNTLSSRPIQCIKTNFQNKINTIYPKRKRHISSNYRIFSLYGKRAFF